MSIFSWFDFPKSYNVVILYSGKGGKELEQVVQVKARSFDRAADAAVKNKPIPNGYHMMQIIEIFSTYEWECY